MMNKRISIIIPCYNCERTLERCLSSILNQTYKNFEIILADDGSSDKTLELANFYKEKYKNVIVLNLEHGGVSNARNKGLEVATGDYIQFVDSDDNFLTNDALEISVKTLEEKAVDLVVYNFTHPCFEPYLKEGLYDLTDDNQLIAYYQDFFSMNLPWNKLFKREVITEPFPYGIAFAEDEIFNYANLKNVKSVYVLKDVLYNYYCEKPQKGQRASAINSSFANGDFLASKNTLWYKGLKNDSFRKEIGDKNFPRLSYYFRHVRLFDFFFWNLEFMCNLEIEPAIMAKECLRLFREEEFKRTLAEKEAFGLKLKTMTNEELSLSCLQFSKIILKTFEKIKRSSFYHNTYFCLAFIFASLFFEWETDKLVTTDVFAKAVSFFSKKHHALTLNKNFKRKCV